MDLARMTLPITTRTKGTITNMNKDQKLIAEAYGRILKEDNLESTVDLEAIANFLNQNDVWSGSPAKGSGGWYVNNSAVTNDDAEGGYSGISVSFVPGDNGLTAYDNASSAIKPIIFEWPVSVQALEKYMQSKTSNL
jgi:hypothetical protein